MYAQMVYKDHKIIELNNRIMEQDQIVIDMQEPVSYTHLTLPTILRV